MIIEHLGKKPNISDSAYVAPTATLCGDVTIGVNCRIMHGAALIAEGGSIVIGDNCIILENAVLRSAQLHSLSIASNVLIGPNAHVVGCTIENNVFVATGASIFHNSLLRKGSEVRINGVVHTNSVLETGETVPIGWVAVGNPAEILPPDKHDEIWSIQKGLDFPETVYEVDRESTDMMLKITERMGKMLESHKNDKILD